MELCSVPLCHSQPSLSPPVFFLIACGTCVKTESGKETRQLLWFAGSPYESGHPLTLVLFRLTLLLISNSFPCLPSLQVKFTTPPKARHSLAGIKRAALKPLQPHATSSKLLVGAGSPRLATVGKKTNPVRRWE